MERLVVALVGKRSAGRSSARDVVDADLHRRRHIVSTLSAADHAIDEVRRIELPVSDWNNVLSAETWNLSLPLTVYELWAPGDAHDRARAEWARFSEDERHASKIFPAQLPYLGSSVILIPRLRPYLFGLDDLMLPGGAEA